MPTLLVNGSVLEFIEFCSTTENKKSSWPLTASCNQLTLLPCCCQVGLRAQEQAALQTQEIPAAYPEEPTQQRRKSKSGGKAARREELQAAVQKLRDALLSADAEAGQEAADQVATLLRASTGAPSHNTRSSPPRSSREGPGHNARSSPPRASREARPREHHPAQQSQLPLLPLPDRFTSPPETGRVVMTQAAPSKPAQSASVQPSARSTRDVGSSPPPQQQLQAQHTPRDEPSLRFKVRPEWDDSFHLANRPTTPRPVNRNMVQYTVDAASSPTSVSSRARKLSVWRNAKRIELARSLSPRREVPVSLSLMNSALRSQSNLGRPNSNRTPRLRSGPSQQRGSGRPSTAQTSSSPRRESAGGNGFQVEQLRRVEELEARMSRLISAVEQRLASTQ